MIIRLRASQRPRRGISAAGRSDRPGRAPRPRRPGRRDAAPAAPGRGRDPRPGAPGPGERPHCRAAGSPVGPDPLEAPHTLHQEMRHAPTEEERPGPRRGNPAIRQDRTHGTDGSDEGSGRGSSWPIPHAKADGTARAVEVPAIEAIYDEVLAQELERRGWECFPPDGPDV